ncbi:hypothetical protein GA0061099_1004150 [Bradyrhizobium yuanmingense]|uniref:Uncharacterized protein n=1 Tax=Bradyrhizobium yuanmingense TaxID=108015 RepID=A0A1C3VKX5_9BRAD|nr:hypothetical protein [Bradyrhizobium yuanmingense]TWI28564.1 hypothetical protein IQ15_01909 [Bradyrhizobium yuanmingense]SCB28396.1 hypothetical protein GA0061099_1004150 [Bradyrhizobium yuanmingense]
MTTIEVDIGPPYGTIAVNADTICAAIADPTSPDKLSNLLIDSAGGRSITALAAIANIGSMLGSNFVQFTAADQAKSVCFVNRMLWVSVAPHPQVTRVSQISFANRRPLSVAGQVANVLSLLRGKPGRTARRAARE